MGRKEESLIQNVTSVSPRGNTGLHSRSRILAVILATLFLYHLVPVSPLLDNILEQIHPAKGLRWKPCLDNDKTLCAYLDVPMDYTNHTSKDIVSIFLRKRPASHKAHQKRLGSILMNPGGPGASGNEEVLDFGEDLYDLLNGRYDIIGFDPRGVNMTLPPIGCQSNPAQAAHLQEALQHFGIPFEARHFIGSGPSDPLAIAAEQAYAKKADAFHAAIARSCFEYGNPELLKHIGTVATARDMKSILEAIGELDNGLNFYGKSYGTGLGATFAALFPEHTNRVVLDGVVDVTTYYRDFLAYGKAGMTHTYQTASGFYASCAAAGPARCALAVDNSTTAASIEERVNRVFTSVARNPLPVSYSSAGTGLLTASDLKLFLFTRLYGPRNWPGLAKGFAEAERGDGTFVFEALYSYFVKNHPSSFVTNPFHKHMGSSFLSTIAIMCGDAVQPNVTSDEFLDYLHQLEDMSPIGQNWGQWQSFCRFWGAKAVERYEGAWIQGEDLKKTRFPILFVSQTNDPVTPLPSAEKLFRAFGNESASLLIQDGYGHCSTAHPSLCTVKRIRDYFLNGVVPDPGTMCEVEPGFLFPDPQQTKASMPHVSDEDVSLTEILDRMSHRNPQLHRIYFPQE
ncbi:hypothetical protein DL93DRAFT_2158340 [Clavulina sp. PMI_390]|nr:hypothetical protein DL93DRAFT_2158340 [Clavulina sp. PMI_390]